MGELSKATVNGWVTLARKRYQLPEGSYEVPADGWVDALEATVSRGLSELCCRINTDARSFTKAAATLERAAQVRLSDETLRQVVLREGQQVATAMAAGALPPVWQAPDCRVKTPQGQVVSRVYATMDGVQTPVVTEAEKQKRRAQVVARRRRLRRQGKKLRPLPPKKPGADGPWKEVKVVACHDQALTNKHVRATFGNHHAAGRILAQATAQLRFHDADEAVGNGDGGPWVVGQFRLRKIPVDAFGLDFFHFSGHVHTACQKVFGEGAPQAQCQADLLVPLAKHHGYDPFWESLLEWRRNTKSPPKKHAIDALIGYVQPRQDLIRYPEFQRRGWNIGSGAIEAECKTVPRRLKGAGMRWDKRSVEPMLALECLEQSGQWHLHWPNPHRSTS